MRPKPGDAGPFVFVLTLIVTIVTISIGYALGLGKAAVLAGLIALFCLIGNFVGSLGPDMRRMAWFGPLVIAATSVPRLLSEWKDAAGIAAIMAFLFLLALLPSVSPRLRMTTVGVSYAVVSGYGMALPAGTPEVHIFFGSALGVAVAAAVRVAAGLGDPSSHTREQIAAPLIARDCDIADVLRSWLIDNPSVWTSTVVVNSLGYRQAIDTALRAVTTADPSWSASVRRVITEIEKRGEQVAEVVTAKQPPSTAPDGRTTARESADLDWDALTGVPPELLAQLREADERLTVIEDAARTRDTSQATDIERIRRSFIRARLTSVFSPQTGALAEASSKAIGVLLASLSGSHIAQPALANTYFNAVVSMLQPTWAETFRRIWYRMAGCIIAVAAVVAVAVYLPAWAMYVTAFAGMFTLTWFLFSHPIISNAGGVVMSVALATTNSGLDPFKALGNFLALIAIAIAIVLLVSLPSIVKARSTTAQMVIDSALDETIATLGTLTDDISPKARLRAFTRGSRIAERLLREAPVMEPDDRQRVEPCARLIDSLIVLATISIDRGADPVSTVVEASAELRGGTPTDTNQSSLDAVVLCARELATTAGAH